MHALSIDLEEWFCSHNLNGIIKFDHWPNLESRIDKQVDLLLLLLEKYDIKATFFILGWLADQKPQLVKKIANEGHEIGCHGYGHQ